MSDARTRRRGRRKVAAFGKPKRMVISSFARAAAGEKPTPVQFANVPNPFAIPARPPQVAPRMALDSNVSAIANWAGQQFLGTANSIAASLIAEGQVFLGFPLLAELSQRPEFHNITDTIATEMTRKWIRFKAAGDQDKSDRIRELEKAFKKFRVNSLFRKCALHDGQYGRAHLQVDLVGADISDAELATSIGDGWNTVTKNKVGQGKLRGFRVIEPVWCYPADYSSSSPFADDFYKPQSWFSMGTKTHASRLIPFIGREVSDMLKPAYSFAGLSLTQMARPYVENWLRVRQSVTEIVTAFSTMVLKTNMTSVLAGEPGANVFNRIDIFNQTRSNRGTMVLDKEQEDLSNVSTPLGTLDALQAQAQEHMSTVSRIPLVKLTGISPSGLNASSEGEIRVFYDFIKSSQESLFADNLQAVMGFIMHHLWGEADPDIEFEFVELWEMTAKERAEIRKMEAETDEILCTIGAIGPQDVRQRIAGDADTPYDGLDPEDMPDIDDGSPGLALEPEDGQGAPSLLGARLTDPYGQNPAQRPQSRSAPQTAEA